MGRRTRFVQICPVHSRPFCSAGIHRVIFQGSVRGPLALPGGRLGKIMRFSRRHGQTKPAESDMCWNRGMKSHPSLCTSPNTDFGLSTSKTASPTCVTDLGFRFDLEGFFFWPERIRPNVSRTYGLSASLKGFLHRSFVADCSFGRRCLSRRPRSVLCLSPLESPVCVE